MPAQTDFRPQLHGFDFPNSWDTDDNYRNFIRSKVHDALPIAAKIVVTNPTIAPALLGALGAVYGIGEAAAPGLFDAIAIPIIINQLVNTVNDKIDNGLPDIYGACGGMAFAPLDYYYTKLVTPKGIFNKTIGKNNFQVPPVDNPQAKVLRDYIYQRFEDTWDAGGVLDKMLEWFVIYQTIPAAFGGGGPELQKRCGAEWQTLAALLDQGKPQPIALLFDTWDIFSNHQVVAYGYGGDPWKSPAFINIYDNNHPNQEMRINFDFTQSEMSGVMADLSGNAVTTTDDHGNVSNEYEPLKGFFCTTYQIHTPPSGWGLQQGLSATSSVCQGVRETFFITDTINNAFTFFEQPAQKTTITPVAADALNINIVPSNYQDTMGIDAFLAAATNMNGAVNFNRAGDYALYTKVFVAVKDSATGIIVLDQFAQPLSRFMYLPFLSPDIKNMLVLHVLDSLQLAPVNHTGNSCYFPFVEGESVNIYIQNLPFKNAQLRYAWTAPGLNTGDTNLATLTLNDLPAAGTTFTTSVKVINLDSGCITTGTKDFTTYTAEKGGTMYRFCNYKFLLFKFVNPRLINPLGPDDPEFSKYAIANFRQFGKTVAQLHTLIGEMKNKGDDHQVL